MNDEALGPGTEDQIINDLRKYGYRLLYGGGFRATCGVRDTVLVLDQWPVKRSQSEYPDIRSHGANGINP